MQVSSDELDRVAMDNLSKNESMQFSSMRDMLKNMMFPDTTDDDPSLDFLLPPAEGPQMYVLEKAEKSNPKHERKSVKAQISEKKAIIAKKAAEKTSPTKNHQVEL